jgi:hypothetical protein
MRIGAKSTCEELGEKSPAPTLGFQWTRASIAAKFGLLAPHVAEANNKSTRFHRDERTDAKTQYVSKTRDFVSDNEDMGPIPMQTTSSQGPRMPRTYAY